MTPEEIRLRALEFATTAAAGSLYEFDDVLRRAEACVAFIEDRGVVSGPDDEVLREGLEARRIEEADLDEAAAKICEPWPDTIARNPGAMPFKPHTLPPVPPLGQSRDPVQMARKALYDAGGIKIVTGFLSGKPMAVPTDSLDPCLKARADAYNALADLHAMQSAEVFHTARRAEIDNQTRASDFLPD
ncbi:hypothetical protein [Phenylobacterium sp.]|uniref:hypothetical protein n=1 Tax=Phenylobacterium sp. TaxID=1871053 RepID=UPI00262B2421|nr:hypothetical protein [Phenylobacterium sp.]